MSNAKKRKNKAYYKNPKNRKISDYYLHAGIQGFLITTTGKERESVREAYFLLNSSADAKYGPEKTEEVASGASENDDEIDFEKELAKERKQIETNKNIPRRFQAVETGAKSTVFIRCRDVHPADLMLYLLSDLEKNKVQRFRYIQRMLPLSHTCKANMIDVKKCLENLLQDFKTHARFKETMSYCILFKTRISNALNRGEIYSAIDEALVRYDCGSWIVDLNDPEIHILVEVIKGVCCFGIVTDFLRYKKYNLHSVVGEDNKKLDTNSANVDNAGSPITEQQTKVKEDETTHLTEDKDKESPGAVNDPDTEANQPLGITSAFSDNTEESNQPLGIISASTVITEENKGYEDNNTSGNDIDPNDG